MDERIYVATRKGLFTVDRNGAGKWDVSRSMFLGDHFSLVMHDPRDGAVYAAQELGHYGVKLQRSTDAGETWTEVGKPAFPEKPEGLDDRDPMGREIPWDTKRIWALAPGGPDQAGVLWCGTIPGGLFRSADHGASWMLVETLWNHPGRKEWFGGGADLQGIHSVCVDPRDSRRVTVGVSCGGVWVTENGGETWDCRADGMWAAYMPPEQARNPYIQDPHLIVQCPAAPDVLWAQHHNGIFRTTDGCASWEEVKRAKPSNFGFAVAVHPTEPDTAWFVPAVKDETRIPVDGKVVVSRTTDGGRSFKVLRNGLPRRHAYDLTWRHSLDVDPTGNTLAFGTTSGSLWVSEDQGDHWQTVSHHLPPIDALRFVKG